MNVNMLLSVFMNHLKLFLPMKTVSIHHLIMIWYNGSERCMAAAKVFQHLLFLFLFMN